MHKFERIFIFAAIAFLAFTVSFECFAKPLKPTVIIDAGHGGFDGGAVAGDGTVEKDINLKIALKLEKLLKFEGFKTVMTRTEDIGTESNENQKIALRKKSDMQNRLSLMKKYPDAIYVSIHLNKFTTSSEKGAQTFYSKKAEKSEALAKSIHSKLVNLIQPQNRRTVKAGTDSTYILRNATVPTVIVECGFLSNRQELKNLKNSEYQSKLAFAIAAGIKDYYINEEDTNG